MLNLLSKIKNGDIEEKFLEKAKKQKLSDDIFSVVTMEDRVSRAGQSVMYGHTLDFYDRYTHNFKNIRKQDIVSVANKYLDFDRAVYTILKPKAEKNERVTSKQKKSPHVGGIPEKVNLKNGLTILFYPETSLPRAYIKIFSLGGIRAEDAAASEAKAPRSALRMATPAVQRGSGASTSCRRQVLRLLKSGPRG